MFKFCHRCRAELPPHDEGTLIFCPHCGAPQVLLSEDLQAQIELQLKAAADGVPAGPGLRGISSSVWPAAIRMVALAAAVAAGLAGVSMLIPPVILLTWLWAIVSPVVVIGFFQARFPMAGITTGFGARLGLLTGLGIALVLSIVNTVDLLVRRLGTNGMGDFDAQWNLLFKQLQDGAAAQSGPQAIPFLQSLALPEFRAGILLAGLAMASAILIVITTAGGAFAGFVRSRPRA